MSVDREQFRFLAGDTISQISSQENLRGPTLPNSSTIASAQKRPESQIRGPENGYDLSLATENTSQPDEQEKHGPKGAGPRNRFSYGMIVSLYQRGWTAEIFSYLFAMISLLGLVTTLLVHQDRPLPKWPSLITINALISIFTSIFRSGLAMALAEGDTLLTSLHMICLLTRSRKVSVSPSGNGSGSHAGSATWRTLTLQAVALGVPCSSS